MPSPSAVAHAADHTLARAAALADPDRLRALAVRVHAYADAVRDDGARLGHRASLLTWHGPAATAFHERALATLAGMHRAAGRVDEAATALRTHADAVGATAGEIRRLAGDLAGAGHLVDVLTRGW